MLLASLRATSAEEFDTAKGQRRKFEGRKVSRQDQRPQGTFIQIPIFHNVDRCGVTFLLALLLNRPLSADAEFLFRLLILVALPLAVIAHIRRFHDLGRSGWGVLLFLIPFLNLAWFIHLLTTPSVATPEPAIA